MGRQLTIWLSNAATETLEALREAQPEQPASAIVSQALEQAIAETSCGICHKPAQVRRDPHNGGLVCWPCYLRVELDAIGEESTRHWRGQYVDYKRELLSRMRENQ